MEQPKKPTKPMSDAQRAQMRYEIAKKMEKHPEFNDIVMAKVTEIEA